MKNRTKIVAVIVIVSVATLILNGCSKSFDALMVGLVDRPQEPKERPYEVKQVSFTTADGIKLAGELTFPKNKEGPFSALARIIHGGSGVSGKAG